MLSLLLLYRSFNIAEHQASTLESFICSHHITTDVSLVQLAVGGAGKIGEKFERGDYTLEEYIDGISKWMGFSV